jgi:N-acetylmuramic acid 6-phosphate etherase
LTRPASSRFAGLLTEGRNPRSQRLDVLPTPKVVRLLLDEDRRALLAASRATSAIARAADAVAQSLENAGRVVFLGAGTSGRLGVLEAAECPPTFGTRPDQIRGVMAGGRACVFGSREGAEDREDHGRREGQRLRAGDILVGISASGVTPFVRGALRAAEARGARTVLLTCVPGRGLGKAAHIVIAIPTGPEVLTGSTRLKAGSATKAALNALTTAAMVRLGKAYENLMVDLKPASAKLQDRARRVVAAGARVSPTEAARLLAESGGEVKTAIVAGRLEISPERARRRLRAAGGHVRRALGAKPALRPRRS